MKRWQTAVVAVFLLVGSSAVLAKEIPLDNVTIEAGSDSGVMERLPWAGQWWSFANAKLSQGVDGPANYTWNETDKNYSQNGNISDTDASPLVKYDRFVERRHGSNPESAIYEMHGDEAADFDHHVDPVEAEKYEEDGIGFGWWGHCNGWAAASLMEREPHTSVNAEGIRFDVRDLKGLLSEVFWGVHSDFTGRRYNDPRWRSGLNDTAKDLLEALDSGSPKPTEEYVEWYNTLYRKWYGDDDYELTGNHTPESFRSVMEWFVGWFDERYTEAFADLKPHIFHQILVTCIKNKQTGVIFDMDAGPEVWNFPAHAYETTITFKENGQNGNKIYTVSTSVYYQSDGVDYAIVGVVEKVNHYTYELETDSSGKPVGGEWTGESVNEHPDFAWDPTYNPTGPDSGENSKVHYGKVLEIWGTNDHKRSDARLVTLSINGTDSDSRRLNREARTVRNPLAASGTLAFTADVSASGVDKVSYYRQAIETVGWSGDNWRAIPTELEHLGDGTGSNFELEWSGSSAGRYMFVVKAFDGSDLVSFDELTVQYTVGGGSTGGGGNTGGGDDDSFEVNNTRQTAASVAAGTHNDLECNDDDWYQVAVTSGQSLTVSISFQHSEGDLDLELVDGSGNQLDSSYSTSNSETVQASGQNGPLFARVYGYGGATAGYALTVTVETTSGGSGGNGGSGGSSDPYEENDTLATAHTLVTGHYSNLQCNDADWYKFEASGAGSARIEFSHSAGDLDLYLYDSNGTEITRSWTTSDNEEVAIPSAGTFYVKVVGYNGATGTYGLTLQ